MIYVVIENCIVCKYIDCVEVCLVDCFYEGENMFVIYLDECIDCGVCEFECFVDVIWFDIELDMEKWVEFNCKYLEIWFVIIICCDLLLMVEEMDGKLGKMELLFENLGVGF